LRAEHEVKVFENRVLRKTLGSNSDEVTGEGRRLLNDEHHAFYFSTNIRVTKSRRMRWVGHIVRMGERRGVYRVLVSRPEGEKPLGRPKHRGDDIKRDIQEMG
jgi:hypothetical protein